MEAFWRHPGFQACRRYFREKGTPPMRLQGALNQQVTKENMEFGHFASAIRTSGKGAGGGRFSHPHFEGLLRLTAAIFRARHAWRLKDNSKALKARLMGR
jgi:hypothetical protein